MYVDHAHCMQVIYFLLMCIHNYSSSSLILHIHVHAVTLMALCRLMQMQCVHSILGIAVVLIVVREIILCANHAAKFFQLLYHVMSFMGVSLRNTSLVDPCSKEGEGSDIH